MKRTVLLALAALSLVACEQALSQSVTVKAGTSFPNHYNHKFGYSFTGVLRYTEAPIEWQFTILDGNSKTRIRQIGTATHLVHFSNVDLVFGFGFSFIDNFKVDGIIKNRNAGFASLAFRHTKDNAVLEVSYNYTQTLASDIPIGIFLVSYGIVIPL